MFKKNFPIMAGLLLASAMTVHAPVLAGGARVPFDKVKPAKAQQVNVPVNLNKADARAIATLSGLGAKRAAAIVAYRQKHGHFKALTDLTKVKGIGTKYLAGLQHKNPGRLLV